MQLSDLLDDTFVIETIHAEAAGQLAEFVGGWNVSSFVPMISEWAEQNRVIPDGQSEFPGKIDHSIAPHMIEIQDCMHPDSGISQVTVMKSTQSLATTAFESVIGMAIKYKLHNILTIISSKNIAKIRSSAAIDTMIDLSGLRDLITPMSTRMKRKLADSTFYKEMHGNRRFMMTSWHSIADAKSLTWSFILMDELDEAPYELRGQGDPEALFAGRGKTVQNFKVAKVSTPTTTTGRINVNFLAGDQRYYFCQCPFCGEKQVLKLFAGGRDYGIRAEYDEVDGAHIVIPETVCCVCKFCKKDIHEHLKGDMLLGGEWRPTSKPINRSYRSYHISNFMSPIMFYSWKDALQEFAETDFSRNITKWKNFVIDVLGEPWESRSEKKNWAELKERILPNPLKMIPAPGLIVAGGADIQKNRIELQCVAWGRDMESWVIDYQVFWGETKIKNGPVWQAFKSYIQNTRYPLKNINLPIALTAIDSGYNPKAPKDFNNSDNLTEHLVYEFVASLPLKTMAVRGNPKLTDIILKQERVYVKSNLKTRFDVAVNELKDETFLKLDFPLGAPGGINFPEGLAKEYYQGFCSEVYTELEPGKFGWKKIFERNEPLDTYQLARAAAERLNIPRFTASDWNAYEKELFNQ